MSEIPFTCESLTKFSGARCNVRGRYLVSVGTRKLDSQYSCGRHLASTCESLYLAENRDSASLTVSIVRGV